MRSRVAILAATGLVALVTVFAGCVDAFRTYQVEAPFPDPSKPSSWNGGPGKNSINEVLTSAGAHCTQCHQGSSAPFGYKLDSYASAIGPDGTGNLMINPADPDNSPIVLRMKGTTIPSMPYDGWNHVPGALAPSNVTTVIRDWIAAGAPEN